MRAREIDVLVVGAGPVGCAMAAALRDTQLRVALLHTRPAAPTFRPIALSYASRLILERLEAWRELASTPIQTVHVSQQGGFGRTVMGASDAGVPALGYVTEYAALLSVLQKRCVGLYVDEALPARCVVHAEGVSDAAREKRYGQDALIARVGTAPSAKSTAFERFTPEGPLALLPLGETYALIWSCRPERALALSQCADEIFLEELQRAAGRRPGTPLAVKDRTVLPLSLRVHRTRISERAVYIGNAAQTLHPVAGQGLNLGMRDAWELSRVFLESQDPGDARTLARYAAARKLDSALAVSLTDALAGAFLGSNRLARAARGAALTALDIFPAPRRFFARRMIYGPSALP